MKEKLLQRVLDLSDGLERYVKEAENFTKGEAPKAVKEIILESYISSGMWAICSCLAGSFFYWHVNVNSRNFWPTVVAPMLFLVCVVWLIFCIETATLARFTPRLVILKYLKNLAKGAAE